ncbi:hypothetical protein [Halobacillus salinus]|uniref:Uncharacterized protein n=1 Tax=Halobacillus salinus TaxID=192814 RepID=A0A4Z0H4D8_9BACI|nr:hypothetical protein [Halobacillus salinus]TGB04970.1 hypothetical protein E4663_08245 [Halobacillus salinus]
MWPTFGIIVITSAIFWLELPKLKKNGQKRDIWCFSVILLTATSVSIMESKGMDVPNPLDYIQSFYKSIFSIIGL